MACSIAAGAGGGCSPLARVLPLARLGAKDRAPCVGVLRGVCCRPVLTGAVPVLYGLYLSAAGAKAQDYRQDVIANNLANVNTTGFKRDLALFRQRLAETEESRRGGQYSVRDLDRLGGGVVRGPTATAFTQGPVRKTGVDFDVALVGDGFLMVEDESGQYLTRDGRLSRDAKGNLTSGGRRVLDQGGSPITVNPAHRLLISSRGDVQQGGATVARLAIVDVPDRSRLRRQGGNVYAMPGGTQPQPATAEVRQGFIEQANVDPVRELVALIEASRGFEANMNMIRHQNTTLGRLVNDVLRPT